MRQTDTDFRSMLAHGREAELWIEQVLREHYRLPARVMPLRVRPDGADPNDYTDAGKDIIVYEKTIVQVKRRDLSFTGLHDFGPGNGRRYETAFIDAEDARFHDAHWFVLTNISLTAAIALEVAGSQDAWIKERAFDRRRQMYRTFISCPLKFFCTLDDMVTSLLFYR